MRRLLLLRHAKTERAEPGEPDRDRKLTARGRNDALAIGAYIARHGLVPELAVISPARRAQETWSLVAAAFERTAPALSDDAIYNAGPRKLMEIIATARPARSLLVVGHNPGLHDVAVQMTGSGDAAARMRLTEQLPTSGLVVIDFAVDEWRLLHPQTGRLERFVSPRQIAATPD